MSAALERAKDQILSGIPERDHVDAMCGVIELIEEHSEEHVKYILGMHVPSITTEKMLVGPNCSITLHRRSQMNDIVLS